MDRVNIVVNDVEVAVPQGKSLLDAVLEAGFDVPHLCHHPAVEAIGACRLCLVELEQDGRHQITTCCNVRVEAGLRVVTDSAEVREHRARNLELLLARAPGAPQLRRLAAEYGIKVPRFEQPPTEGIKNCILCELCVRVCSMLEHDALVVIGRGEKKRIGLPFNRPSTSCVGCTSCAAVCPTSCIPVKRQGNTLSIWGQQFEMVSCSVCGEPFMTVRHRQHLARKLGIPEENYDRCESCKQAEASRRFASVVW